MTRVTGWGCGFESAHALANPLDGPSVGVRPAAAVPRARDRRLEAESMARI
ncbi:hypothetical protein [Haloterrigena alkaliphila]|uniref:Uncharacterized protein n=1 Tax=Haloterrigena alkaliphila TaxID=2816475 RepID=A0A8A2VQE0_9EURY|nr:hypothetical protein [Haloterrigena alkaliphila]QSX00319.1 hypothetical protein J0X25_04965 [Haloterrigena alkaliphila]